MTTIWGDLVSRLGLEPDLGRVGAPRPRQSFAGRYDGARLTLTFDVDKGAVRGAIARRADNVLSGTDSLRILPRAGLGGWDGGPKTGDRDFDDQVAILSDAPEDTLLQLDRGTRALLAEMVEIGAWITDDQILLEPRAMASATTATHAMDLLKSAVDLLRALRDPSPEQLIEMAFGDPAEPQRRRARGRVMRLAGGGGRWVRPILEAIERHDPPEGPDLLRQIASHCGEHFDAWLAGCDRYAAANAPTLLAGLPTARQLGQAAEDALVDRIAKALVTPGLQAPTPEAMAADGRLVRALVPRLKDHPAALWHLAQVEVPGEDLRVTLIAALAERDPEGATARLVGLKLVTPQGEGARVTALSALPPALGLPALAGLRPASAVGRRALFEALCAHRSPVIDAALVEWVIQKPTVVDTAMPRARVEAAKRVCEALDLAPDHPLLSACGGPLPPAFAVSLSEAICAAKPRHGAVWLVRHAPDLRGSDPTREAALLEVLGALGDPAGEPRCLAALDGSDYLRIVAARALTAIGTARALAPLDALTGFFASGEVKAAAKAAIEAIRERETRGPRGGLSVSAARGGEISLPDE